MKSFNRERFRAFIGDAVIMAKLKILSADYPKTIPVPNMKKNRLLEPITVNWVDKNGLHKKFTIQQGKHSDGASIPKIFWTVIGDPFNPRFARAAWFHDYMAYRGADQKEVSEVFYRLLLEDGTNRIKANLMKYAVWIFVSLYYKVTKK